MQTVAHLNRYNPKTKKCDSPALVTPLYSTLIDGRRGLTYVSDPERGTYPVTPSDLTLPPRPSREDMQKLYPVTLPDEIRAAAEAGATLAVSISGGKDSHAMLAAVVACHRYYGWTGRIYAIHADTGRTEWPQTQAHCERLAARYGVELVVVKRGKGDLLDRWAERMEALRGTGKPFWSSAANRYCTSDLKRDPINKNLRTFDHVISVEGIRADESPARAKKPAWELRKRICTKSRTAYDWRPILKWSEAQVWKACGASLAEINERRALYAAGREAEALEGWVGHPAYVFGNSRLSCVICVLASKADILNGIKHNPEHYAALSAMETESGFTMRKDISLAQLAASAPAACDACPGCCAAA